MRTLSDIRLPIFAAPMLKVSGVRLVLACVRAGIPAILPALGGKKLPDFKANLEEIKNAIGDSDAPYGVSLSLQVSPAKLAEEVRLCVEFEVPIVVTAAPDPRPAIEKVHSYGGKVFHEVATVENAKKSARMGVDGLILICSGGTGHLGSLSPFSFVPAVRSFFSGVILVAGVFATGESLLAVKSLGGDYGYAGTCFIACEESLSNLDALSSAPPKTFAGGQGLRPTIAEVVAALEEEYQFAVDKFSEFKNGQLAEVSEEATLCPS